MIGERLAWHRVASHLQITVPELAERITPSEFSDWIDYLEWETNHHSKADYYLAQIAAMILRSVTGKKDQKKIRLKDFLLRFERPDEVERRTKSKSAWLGWLEFFKRPGLSKPRPKPGIKRKSE